MRIDESMHLEGFAMPYSYNDRPRGYGSGQSRSSHGRPSGDRRQGTAHVRDAQRRESRTPYRSNRNYRTISGHDAGLNVHNNSRIGFDRSNFKGSRRRGGLLSRLGLSNRGLAVLLVGLVLLILLIFGISSCVTSCNNSGKQTKSAQKEVNSYDGRVAAGVSESLTKQFTPVLDQNKKLSWIAAHADEYADARLCQLALREDSAIDFVAGLPKAKATGKKYGDGNEKGSYPLLYDWDARWGYVKYADSVMGVTGSGPTSLSMAYMGLTGKTDQTPNALAELSTEGKYTDKGSGTKKEFFTKVGAQVGLSVKEYTSSADNLSIVLSNGVAIVQLNANFTTPYAHWALVIKTNDDGSVTMYDPDSTSASGHTWAAGTIAKNASTLLSVTAAASSDDSSSR